MNILYLTYGMPYPPHSGARLRDCHMIRQLESQHRVTCVCLLEPSEFGQTAPEEAGVSVHTFPQEASYFGRLGSVAHHLAARQPLATADYHSGRMLAFVRSLLAAETFDAVQIEHSFLAPYICAITPALRSRAVLDMHNIGELQYQRAARLPGRFAARISGHVKARMMRGWEIRAARRFARVIVTSAREAEWILSRAPDLRVSVIENGVDTESIAPLPDMGGPPNLLFVGTMGYLPNIDAMQWFSTEILPRVRRTLPDASLEIVGRRPSAAVRALAGMPGVRLHEDVERLVPYYSNAQLVVVPLRAGSGTRLKILEAMAYGRPVVSTTAGAGGLDVADGENILLADDPDRLTAQITRLCQDAVERRRIARNARALVETRYSWSRIGERLRDLYGGLV